MMTNENFRVDLFSTKAEAKENNSELSFWFKIGNFKFAAVESRDRFIKYCMHIINIRGCLPAIYEVVHGIWPRLYVDIEMEFTQRPTKECMDEKISNTLQIIKNKLVDVTQLDSSDPRLKNVCVTTNHRFKKRECDGKRMWNLSAHVVYPDIRFEKNSTGMKHFVTNCVNPALKKKDDMNWIKIQKNGAEARTLIDLRTYSNEQAFRLPFTSKTDDKKLILKPYNLETQTSLEISDMDECKTISILSDCIISRADHENCVLIYDNDILPAPQKTFSSSSSASSSSSSSSLLGTKELHYMDIFYRNAVSEKILPFLKRNRFADTEEWLRIGYGLSNTYGGDIDGLNVFKKYSSRERNYDEQKCEDVYKSSNCSIKFGSFLVWLQIDAPGVAKQVKKEIKEMKEKMNPKLGLKSSEWFKYLTTELIDAGREKNYKRYFDKVMKQHSTISGVFVEHKSDVDFINSVLETDDIYHSKPWMSQLKTWFIDQNHQRFPIVNSPREDVISFTNGVLFLHEGLFREWSEIDTPPFTFRYREIVFDSELCQRATPLWDNLIMTQLTNEDVFDVFEVMIGRLNYPAGYDNYKVLPFLKGDANTGKSTVIEIVQKMFPSNRIGVISANNEKKFGLETLHDKLLVVAPDIPKKMQDVFEQTILQAAVGGEYVNIPQKNKQALSVKWSAPQLWAGNNMPDYTDNSGSISRRFVVFLFETLVKTRDLTLQGRIIANEIDTIMIRCVMKYNKFRIENEGKDIWEVVPKSMLQTRERIKEETNHLANFLANGNDHYDVIFDKSKTTDLVDLKKAFHNHMKYTMEMNNVKMGSDHHPIKAKGFIVVRPHICKICGATPATKQQCGKHYDPKNRKRKYIIKHMDLVKKSQKFSYNGTTDGFY